MKNIPEWIRGTMAWLCVLSIIPAIAVAMRENNPETTAIAVAGSCVALLMAGFYFYSLRDGK